MSTDTGTTADRQPIAVDRLAGLGRLWGAVRYFHPSLASGELDWDAALVETIPRVRASTTAAQYRAAVEHMLAFLRDPATRTLDPPASDAAPARGDDLGGRSSAPQPSVHRTEDGVAVVSATGGGGELRAAVEQAADARALVLDLRCLRGESSWLAGWAVANALPALLADPIRAAGSRHRMHSGHRQQRGPAHGGYYSAWVSKDGEVLAPRGGGRGGPLAFVVDAASSGLYPMLGGFQSAGLAAVVHAGEPDAEAGIATCVLKLPDGVRAQVRLSEYVYPDGAVGFRPDEVVLASGEASWDRSPEVSAALAAVRGGRFRRTPAAPTPPLAPPPERDYPEMAAPSPEYRLLALFRFWNAIHYLFPYKHLLDGDWGDVLREFVPTFAREGDTLDYVQTVARLSTRIGDTHGFVQSEVLDDHLGRDAPFVRVREIEGETVVTGVFGEAIGRGVHPGDVVLAVDGEEVGARRTRLGELFAASTPQALRWRVHHALLGGPEGSVAILTVRDRDGEVREAPLPRIAWPEERPHRPTPVFGVLPEGCGYMDLERLTVPQVDEAFDAVRDTSALIFDLRGYPNGTAWEIAPRLSAEKVVTARFEVPELHGETLDPDDPNRSASTRRFVQTAEPSPKGRYEGKVVVLIDESAFSQSEHTCLFLEAAADVTYIGSPTNGANGDVTNVVLPGGVTMSFTGMDVRHGDGRQLQRMGIQPHILVEPTISGIRDGRDEVLEAAISFLADEAAIAAQQHQPSPGS